MAAWLTAMTAWFTDVEIENLGDPNENDYLQF
jgi:hypothetical protein